jgi:hypothetical protein
MMKIKAKTVVDDSNPVGVAGEDSMLRAFDEIEKDSKEVC